MACTHDNLPVPAADATHGDGGQLEAGSGDAGPGDAGSGDIGRVPGSDTAAADPDAFQFPDMAGNQAPNVAWLAPAAGAVVQVGVAVQFVAKVGDDNTAPVDLALDLTLTAGSWGGGVAMAVDASGTVSFASDSLPPGKNTLLLTVYDQYGLSDSATLTVLVNTAPGAPVVAIEPATPKTTDDLVAVLLQPAVDPDTGEMPVEKHVFQWLMGGTVQADLTGPQVPADRTKAGEVWTVVVRASDDSAVGLEASASVTVDDSAPGPVGIALAPTAATVGSTLECMVTSPALDADGDEISYLTRWTLNGEDLPEAGTATTLALASKASGAWLPILALKVGDVIGCRVHTMAGSAVGPTAEVTATLGAFDACQDGGGGCPAHTTCATSDTAAAACPCATGYDGPGGKDCTDVDECTLGLAECVTNSVCSNTEGSFACTCNPGWAGDLASGATCSDVDECQDGTAVCDLFSECSNTAGGYSCPCLAGFAGDGAKEGGCAEVDECATGLAACDLSAACSNTAGSYTCKCNEGFLGDPSAGSGQVGKACSDVDECADGSAVCDLAAACTNTVGSYACTCKPGYNGDGKACQDIDECSLGLYQCDPHSACGNLDGSYLCKCDAGWVGDGAQCDDVDECKGVGLADCATQATCSNNPGAYDCTCKTGWLGLGFGAQGCADVDECLTGQFVCADTADCNNLAGDYQCKCGAGYVGDGKLCDDVDECAAGTAICDPAAICKNAGGGYTCACKPGWTGDGKTCAPAPQ